MSTVNKNAPFTITFPAIDTNNRPLRKSGIIFVTGNTQISQNGGSFVNTINVPAEISSSGRYSLLLAATEMNAGNIHVKVSLTGIDDSDIILITGNQPSGSVVANVGNTSSSFETTRPETATDFWKYSFLQFTTGSLTGQVRLVTGYNGSTFFMTTNAYTGIPSAGDDFILINE